VLAGFGAILLSGSSADSGKLLAGSVVEFSGRRWIRGIRKTSDLPILRDLLGHQPFSHN
jgi:hypothetical protein